MHNGSLFPTNIGANPQLSVYAHARLFAMEIARATGTVTPPTGTAR